MGNDFIEGHRGAPPESWAAPFRKAFSLRGRHESRLKWYFIWARRFAACLSGRSLHLATRNDAEGFLTTLASSPGINAWQVEQATDALTILLGSVFGQEWVRTIRIPAPPPPRRPASRGGRTGRTFTVRDPMPAQFGSYRTVARYGGGNGSPRILLKSERSTSGTWNFAMPERPSGPLSSGSTPARPASGPGSTSSRPRVFGSTDHGENTAPPPARDRPAAGRTVRGAQYRYRKARRLPHAAALLRHPPARVGRGHPHGAGTARAQRRLDDDDLHPRPEPARPVGTQPRGRVGGGNPVGGAPSISTWMVRRVGDGGGMDGL